MGFSRISCTCLFYSLRLPGQGNPNLTQNMTRSLTQTQNLDPNPFSNLKIRTKTNYLIAIDPKSESYLSQCIWITNYDHCKGPSNDLMLRVFNHLARLYMWRQPFLILYWQFCFLLVYQSLAVEMALSTLLLQNGKNWKISQSGRMPQLKYSILFLHHGEVSSPLQVTTNSTITSSGDFRPLIPSHSPHHRPSTGLRYRQWTFVQ